MDNVPDYVSAVLKTLGANGYKSYLVGGCLRDTLLKRNVNDWDVATPARASDVMRLFPKTVKTGARFGTVAVVTENGMVEVTTFRSDGAYSDRRRPDSVSFVSDLHEDLRRRDFTVNAMAMAEDGVLLDPFGGREDLHRRLIRCVGDPQERFSEDALRMFRALRFSAQLDFEIEDGTLAAISKSAASCAALSAERVRDETEKILLSSNPSRVGTAISLGLYQGRLSGGPLAPEKIQRLSGLPKKSALRWSGFSALLAENKMIASPAAFLKNMRLDAKTIRCCTLGIKTAEKALPDSENGLKKLMSEIGVDAAECAAAAEYVLRGTNILDSIRRIEESGECFSVRQLAVTGDDLIGIGYRNGVALGQALGLLLNHVIEHPQDNEKAALLALAQRLLARSD